MRMINCTKSKIENTFKYKYNQQYGQSNQSNTIKSNIINNTAKAI